MNYNLIKYSYLVIGLLTIILSLITIFFSKSVLKIVSTQQIIVISVVLLIPFFILKFVYEKKYPPKRWQFTLGYTFLALMIIYLANSLYRLLF